MKVLVTGGHITPALAVLDYLKECDVVVVGRKFANDLENKPSFEFQEVMSRNLRFIHLNAGRLTRVADGRSLLNMTKLPQGFVEAVKIVRSERPDVVLSFGGYLAAPIVLVASLLRIPVVTHEQTIAPGLANRFIGALAKTICVSFPETKQLFDPRKVVVTGNPVRQALMQGNQPPEGYKKKKSLIYITGGSLGSHSINKLIFEILPDLLKKHDVIHQTGNIAEFADFQKATELRQAGYYPYEHIPTDQLGYVLKNADIIIGRAGANTVAELLVFKKPSILIPLPWAAGYEQNKHAMYLQRLRVAEVFDQSRPATELLQRVEMMSRNIKEYQSKFNTLPAQHDTSSAAQRVAQATLEASGMARNS